MKADAIDTEASQAYLCTGNLLQETEEFLPVIRDRAVAMRVYWKKIINENGTTTKCRICSDEDETFKHLIAGWSVMAPKAYLDWHNRVAKIIYLQLQRIHFDLKESPRQLSACMREHQRADILERKNNMVATRTIALIISFLGLAYGRVVISVRYYFPLNK